MSPSAFSVPSRPAAIPQSVSCSRKSNPPAIAQGASRSDTTQVTMRTNEDCALAVSVYPRFSYDARGGGSTAQGHHLSDSQRVEVSFPASEVAIPDVSYETARFVGVPLLPIFRIAIDPQSLQGTIDRGSGAVELQFVARFNFTSSLYGWRLYTAPPLLVTTQLTTEAAAGGKLGGKGSAMQPDGSARLVGVSEVAATGDWLLDAFLRQPALYHIAAAASISPALPQFLCRASRQLLSLKQRVGVQAA